MRILYLSVCLSVCLSMIVYFKHDHYYRLGKVAMVSFKNEFNRPYRAIIPINLKYIKLSYKIINVIMISES